MKIIAKKHPDLLKKPEINKAHSSSSQRSKVDDKLGK
jgi:hypothetical protein